MTSVRSVVIYREASGEVHASHLGQPVTFANAQQLWNFVTLDVSHDRQSFARPPRRNAKEEAEAIAAFLPSTSPDEILRRALQKLKENLNAPHPKP